MVRTGGFDQPTSSIFGTIGPLQRNSASSIACGNGNKLLASGIGAMREGNRHPADRLADVRRQIEELEIEVNNLRAYLMEHPEDREGDEHTATIGSSQKKHVNLAALEREIGSDTLQRFTNLKPVAVVRLRERKREAAE
jgi:hypothetical protein